MIKKLVNLESLSPIIEIHKNLPILKNEIEVSTLLLAKIRRKCIK